MAGQVREGGEPPACRNRGIGALVGQWLQSNEAAASPVFKAGTGILRKAPSGRLLHHGQGETVTVAEIGYSRVYRSRRIQRLWSVPLPKCLVLFFLVVVTAARLAEARDEVPLLSWPEAGLPLGLMPHDVVLSREQAADTSAVLGATFLPGPWPNLWFVPEGGATWDWHAYAGLGIRVFNDSDEAVLAALRVDNAGADGTRHCLNYRAWLPPKQSSSLEAFFPTAAMASLWGMRGLPVTQPLFEGARLDMAAITACQLFLPGNAKERRLLIEAVYLVRSTDSGSAAFDVQYPFVDRFGQYRHALWPGKLQSEEELRERDAREATAPYPPLADRDRFGGWSAGPQLEATGWFRTEKHQGKWWLVTPEGRLFLSIGVNCVGTWEQTFVEQREHWFEWLPQADEPLYGELLSHWEGAHSGAEGIGGSGRVFSFYRANLARTFGRDWKDRWRVRTLRRLEGWGFNTLGNWSQSDVTTEHRLPYVASVALTKVPVISEAPGHWSSMMDVFDESFSAEVERAISGITARNRANPLCIGYFVDNELAWEGVLEGVLRSSESQPARRALVVYLQQTYPTLEVLNAAWGTAYAEWGGIRAPDTRNAACSGALDEFLLRFARRYFKTIGEALDRHAPDQLYLGCRFASAPDPVVRACAEFADVVSFNQYVPSIDCSRWLETHPVDVPMVIGEFHFGALDRGMFHGGLQPVASQQERAQAYRAYWEALARCPRFVGAHWFQYADEPLTGRSYDGENYNIGLVDVTDTPYPELVDAARDTHDALYRLRLEVQPGQVATQ